MLALSLRKRCIGPARATAAGYVVACQVPIFSDASRRSPLELAQTLRGTSRILMSCWLLAAVAPALNRAGTCWLDARRPELLGSDSRFGRAVF